MSNLPRSLSMNVPFGAGPNGAVPGCAGAQAANKDRKMASAEQSVLDLSNTDLRENALLELSKRENFFEIWLPCCGILPARSRHFCRDVVFQGFFVSIYPMLSPPTLNPAQSNRVCNALALLQGDAVKYAPMKALYDYCVASHPHTRMLFLKAHIPLYLFPFINTGIKTRPFEYLRLTSLGVIGALVKVDDTEVICFLLSTKMIPLCLRTMEMGSELSKTVATFIVQTILLDDLGLDYICTTAELYFAVGRVLAHMVAALAEQPSSRLLKHIIRCYLRLADNPRVCDALQSCLPVMLRDGTFSACLREDPTTRRWLQQLLNLVGVNRVSPHQPGIGFEHMMVS